MAWLCQRVHTVSLNRLSPAVTISYIPHSIHYMYRTVVTIYTARFNTQQSYLPPTQCMYVFCVDLRTNGDYFPIRH